MEQDMRRIVPSPQGGGEAAHHLRAAAQAAAGFGVYVHWPFCASKCPYCDFNSHVRHGGAGGGIDEPRFRAALLGELAHWAELTPRRTVSSVFFGGGTPSLMNPATVGSIIEAITRHWPLEAGAEITLEANPSSVEAGRFRGYRDAGVNRVSMGVQSLDDAVLRSLGRLHTAAEALAAIEIARTTFARFSFDLIYARPGQTPAAWRDELRRALALAGSHLSLYQLTIEPGTPFAELYARGKLKMPEGETARAFYHLTQELCEGAGLPAYEISNHAAPGEECRHNLLYWRYGEYAGIGPGAHGRAVIGGMRRATSTERHPERWAALVEEREHGLAEMAELTPAEEADEALLMGMRLDEGIDLSRLEAMTGFAPNAVTMADLVAAGLVEHEGTRVRATAAGRIVLDQVVLRLAAAMVDRRAQQGAAALRR
ncbi:MAG TPA: radical SAM family heme chaperone HemW [Hyphomicrobiaceae bacterium]|nr:radical SAM family heme chaperone HemW [Hyphomicrobiaceae bacterium]